MRLLSRGCYREVNIVVIARLLSRGCYREVVIARPPDCYREVVIVRLLS